MNTYKFIIVLIFTFISYNVAYSAENGDVYTKAIKADVIKYSTDNHIPIITLGLQGGGFIQTGSTYDIGNGGGVGINVKTNINKYFATLIQLNYTYASYKPYANSSHFIDTRALIIVQKETTEDKNGIVPWAGLGVSFNTGFFSVLNNYASFNGLGVGLILTGGLRYNIKKIYIGANIEYNLAIISTDIQNYYGQYYGIDPSGVRINAEIGFRL